MKVAGIQWDAGNWPKCGKHGVSRDEIEFVLRNGPGVAPDWKHSTAEDRFIAVGRNSDGRPLFVGFTLRDVDGVKMIRPVTARYMRAKEAQRYGAQSKDHGSKDEER